MSRTRWRGSAWATRPPIDAALRAATDAEGVLAACKPHLEKFRRSRGLSRIDVESVDSGTPELERQVAAWRSEHIHSEPEARYLVSGMVGYYLHIGARLFELVLVPGGWIEIPPVRTYDDPEGWVPYRTGSRIAERSRRVVA